MFGQGVEGMSDSKYGRVRMGGSALLGSALLLTACGEGQKAQPDRFHSVPPACGLLSSATTQKVVGDSDGSQKPGTESSKSCEWEYKNEELSNSPQNEYVPWRRALSVSVHLYEAQGEVMTGAELAHQTLSGMRQQGSSKIEGIGDEAYCSVVAGNGYIRFRVNNMMVWVRYMESGEIGEKEAEPGKKQIASIVQNVAREARNNLRPVK